MSHLSEVGDPVAASHSENHDGNFLIVVIAFLIAIVVVLTLELLFLSGTGQSLIPG